MTTASDVYDAAMALMFEDDADIESDDIYARLFPQQMKRLMYLCLPTENSRRRAEGRDKLTFEEINHMPHGDSAFPLPFCDDICITAMPLHIASEWMRDQGQFAASAYFREQFTSALDECKAITPEDVGDVFEEGDGCDM